MKWPKLGVTVDEHQVWQTSWDSAEEIREFYSDEWKGEMVAEALRAVAHETRIATA